MDKQYRTMEQFNEIMESVYNGNWTQAAQECIEYGFYAHDLVTKLEDFNIENGNDTNDGMDSLVYLVEVSTEIRNKKLS